jgi:RNA polymerase sigma-70 factor (ECF subfamily)
VELVLRSSEAEHRESPDNGGPGGLSEAFVTLIAGAQRPLYAYIRSLVGPGGEAEDILQEVNLVLCRKADEYDGRGQFLTWACRIAYLQVLANLKRRQRDRHVYFDEAVLADLAGTLAGRLEQLDSRQDALHRCLGRLSEQHRQMITARYVRGGSVQKVAQEVGRPAGSVRVTLHRIRTLLLQCMQRTLAEGNA